MYFKLIFWIIVILLITFFVIFNVEPKVRIFLFPGITLENMPLALVIIISLILGFLSGLLLAFSNILKLQRKIKKLENKKET
ncbi:MAG: LapA family protein [Thermodesulfobacteriaceae bacterium]|nr:LapA family protein [Thermodesulfobacteriaceae bacterium]MCX8041644.1 LapA family protein [Thermodesulfobacteriaceae bacterium]MDW8136075.1 LapA family protein [Thermodesulfobacterium sp.]